MEGEDKRLNDNIDETVRRSESEEAGLSPTQAGSSHTQRGPYPTLAGPFPTQAGTFPNQAGSFPTHPGLCPTQAGPSHVQAQSSYTQDTINLHTGNIQCKQCKRVYRHERSLKRHMKTHEEDSDLFECDHCGKHFSRIDTLNIHIKNIHSNRKPEYQCSNCDKKFTNTMYMNYHIRYHCPKVKKRLLVDNTEDESASEDVDIDSLEEGAAVVEPGSSNVTSGQPSNSDKEKSCRYCGKGFTVASSSNHHIQYCCQRPSEQPSLDNTDDECTSVDEDQPSLDNTDDECTSVDEDEDSHDVGSHDQAAVVEPGPCNVTSGQTSNLGGYGCSKCGCQFNRKHNLVQHLKLGCNSRFFLTCPDPSCSFKTAFVSKMNRHLFRHK